MALRQLEDALRQLQLRAGEILQRLGLSDPVGKIDAYAGSTAPAGWLMLDGAAVSRVANPRLFALIGTTYGAGNGSTTFNLPNAKGRSLVGRDAAQTEFDQLGETGGAKTHTLTEAQMPSHQHAPVNVRRSGVEAAGWGLTTASPGFADRVFVTGAYNSSNGLSVGATGGGQAHNILQPYLTVNYIIRAG